MKKGYYGSNMLSCSLSKVILIKCLQKLAMSLSHCQLQSHDRKIKMSHNLSLIISDLDLPIMLKCGALAVMDPLESQTMGLLLGFS